MNRIKLTSNFFLDEYIPRELYLRHVGKEHRLIGCLNKGLVNADQMLRNHFGPTTINNWWGYDLKDESDYIRQWSGIRTPDSSYYSETSQHSYANASDKIYKLATAKEVREYIKVHWKELGITCIEKNANIKPKNDWVHSDLRWWRGNKLLIV